MLSTVKKWGEKIYITRKYHVRVCLLYVTVPLLPYDLWIATSSDDSLFYPSEQLKQRLDAEIKNLTQLNCVDALPVALMSYHMQANRMTHLTPHEMLEGRLMPSSKFRGPHKGAIRNRCIHTKSRPTTPETEPAEPSATAKWCNQIAAGFELVVLVVHH